LSFSISFSTLLAIIVYNIWLYFCSIYVLLYFFVFYLFDGLPPVVFWWINIISIKYKRTGKKKYEQFNNVVNRSKSIDNILCIYKFISCSITRSRPWKKWTIHIKYSIMSSIYLDIRVLQFTYYRSWDISKCSSIYSLNFPAIFKRNLCIFRENQLSTF